MDTYHEWKGFKTQDRNRDTAPVVTLTSCEWRHGMETWSGQSDWSCQNNALQCTDKTEKWLDDGQPEVLWCVQQTLQTSDSELQWYDIQMCLVCVRSSNLHVL